MSGDERPEALLQERMLDLIRAFGLHRPDNTPCGQPVAVSEAHALLELSRTPALTPTDLAARLRLDRSTVTRLVQHLAARGWLVREPDMRDGRSARLRLTAVGHDASAQLAAARSAKFAGIAVALTPQERDAVLRGLELLVRALDQNGVRAPASAATKTDAAR